MGHLPLCSLPWIVRVSEPKTSSKRLECKRGAVSCRERPIRSLKASLAWWFFHTNNHIVIALFIAVAEMCVRRNDSVNTQRPIAHCNLNCLLLKLTFHTCCQWSFVVINFFSNIFIESPNSWPKQGLPPPTPHYHYRCCHCPFDSDFQKLFFFRFNHQTLGKNLEA